MPTSAEPRFWSQGIISSLMTEVNRWAHFLKARNLISVNSQISSKGPCFTYTSGNSVNQTMIDHVFIESSKLDMIPQCCINDDSFLYVSDHLPITLSFNCEHKTSKKQNELETVNWKKVRVEDKQLYSNQSRYLINNCDMTLADPDTN